MSDIEKIPIEIDGDLIEYSTDCCGRVRLKKDIDERRKYCRRALHTSLYIIYIIHLVIFIILTVVFSINTQDVKFIVSLTVLLILSSPLLVGLVILLMLAVQLCFDNCWC